MATNINPTQQAPAFDTLPKELKLDIWEISGSSPHIITIQAVKKHLITTSTSSTNPYEDNQRGIWLSRIEYQLVSSSNAGLSELLHACHDSRQVVLKRHTFSFGDRLIAPALFDKAHDTLLFVDVPTLCQFVNVADDPRQLRDENIKFIGIGCLAKGEWQDLGRVARDFGALEKIFLMAGGFPFGHSSEETKEAAEKKIREKFEWDTKIWERIESKGVKIKTKWAIPEVVIVSGVDDMAKKVKLCW